MNPSRNYRIVFVLIATLNIVFAATAGYAGDDSGRAILKRAIEHYAKLDAYAAKMEINLKLPEGFSNMAGGMEPSRYEAVAARDGRVAFRPKGGGMIVDPFVQNAEQWYVGIDFFKAYVLLDAVSIDQLLDDEGDQGIPILGCSASNKTDMKRA